TKGKTTTATICANILRLARPDTVLAGNMGTSALAALPQLTPETPVVIELSSWQLEGLAEHGMSPHIGILTNITEDHLNSYSSMEEYIEAKRHIVRFQGIGDWFIVNRDDPLAWQSRHTGSGRIIPFGFERDVDADRGAWLESDRLIWHREGMDQEICRVRDLPLPGPATIMNALAASAAALLLGATEAQARAALVTQQPIPHRQEPVATIDGVLYVNDTAATAPAAAIAALDTYRGRPVVLIAGGASKRTDLTALARRAATDAAAVVLLDGSATPEFRQLLLAAGVRHLSGPHNAMEPAVRAAATFAEPGSVVLLAPGCASFGIFRDEFHRGEAFHAAVDRLAVAASTENQP
ncbi:MAG TPA: UDP-N-acetylmuramoyl-L-alanine--D-glutamate ligase, partial [Nitrolancea sp.]|nr:UDP-N-acetylmuramoyl-L-alanine--D-glutamate ligase [Nitrolancea sp.]